MIKELRVKIDGLHKLTKELKGSEYYRQLSPTSETLEAAHNLLYAKAWLGKCLAEIGVESPYKSGYKTVDDIEPTADVANPLVLFRRPDGTLRCKWPDGYNENEPSHIEKVDWLRIEIQKMTEEVKEIPTQGQSREFAIARTNAYNYLCEARFALGFELQRIKEL